MRAGVIRVPYDFLLKAMRVQTGLAGIGGEQSAQSPSAEHEEGRAGGKDSGHRKECGDWHGGHKLSFHQEALLVYVTSC